jgi:hypothetical protein
MTEFLFEVVSGNLGLLGKGKNKYLSYFCNAFYELD